MRPISGRPWERITLGCDKLGSVNSVGDADAAAVLDAALAMGVRSFDTAPIYGQGGSERILGHKLHMIRGEVTIITKVGQYFPFSARVLFPAKKIIRYAANNSARFRQLVKAQRGGLLPQSFTDDFIESEVKRSLDRLRTDHIDVLLLHSPPAEEVRSGSGLDTLRRLRERGLVRRIGVASEDVEGALIALENPLVEVVEFPFVADAAFDRALRRAEERGVATLVRGVLRAHQSSLEAASAADRGPIVRRALEAVLDRPEVSTTIVGTTRVRHLEEILTAARIMNVRTD